MNVVSKNTIMNNFGKKKILLFALIAILGIIIIIISNFGGDAKAEEVGVENLDPSKYAKEIEEKVESLCNRVDGVRSTYAVVTLKGGYRAIYATDSQSGTSSSKNATVIIGSGTNEKALLLGYENPEIAGIGIVCSGGDDYNVRKDIISIVSSALGVSSNKIFVSGS